MTKVENEVYSALSKLQKNLNTLKGHINENIIYNSRQQVKTGTFNFTENDKKVFNKFESISLKLTDDIDDIVIAANAKIEEIKEEM